jgi:hypothetical protein
MPAGHRCRQFPLRAIDGFPSQAIPVLLHLGMLAFTLGVLFPPAAAAQTKLIFTEYQYNNPKIKSMNLDGSGVAELFTIPPAEWLPLGCDYDSDGQKVYWTHGSTPGTIRRANLDGSGMQLLVSNLKLPRGISVDAVNGKMYWVQAPPAGNALGLLKRANLDGSGVETIYAVTPYDPTLSYIGRPTVDPVNGYVYFCCGGEIRRVKLDGTGYVQTAVRGVTTVTALALDVSANQLYFLDANTNSDYLGRANLDDTGFTVVYDNTPGSGGSSGLIDLDVDVLGGKVYWSDEFQKSIKRANLDGSSVEQLYTSPGSLTPTDMSLDYRPMQPIMDCNNNQIRDLDDIESGFSEDCNFNGIPDECEDDPCGPPDFVLDHGSDPSQSHRVLSGDPVNGYEIFQPFDLTTPETIITGLDLDGYTVIYHPTGFRATIFPDDGTGNFPDESAPIAWTDCHYRFSTNTIAWSSFPIAATLGAGRYWIRLTAQHTDYDGAACVGTSGLPSLSRRSNGTLYYSTHSIALRLRAGNPAAVPEASEASDAGTWQLFAAPNPMRSGATVSLILSQAQAVRLAIHDPAGRLVRLLLDGRLPAGTHTLGWDGRDMRGRPVGAGIYLLSLDDGAQGRGGRAGREASARQILVLR